MAFRTKGAAILQALHAEATAPASDILARIAVLAQSSKPRAKVLRNHGARLRDPTLSLGSLRKVADAMGIPKRNRSSQRQQLHAEMKAVWLQQVKASAVSHRCVEMQHPSLQSGPARSRQEVRTQHRCLEM